MVAGIYLITNKKTGQKYVGGSIDIENRMYFHEHSPNNGSYIDDAIQKYGFDSFDWQVIEKLPADWKIIGKREKYWIKFYNTFKNKKHYNLDEGGVGRSGYTHTQQTKDKMSKSKKGKYSGKNNPMYGKKHTPETRKKMSENQPDKSGENNGMWNKNHTIESKRKMSENRKGKCTNENNPKYRYDIPSPQELLEEYNSSDTTYKKLGEKYNCSPGTIHKRIQKAKKSYIEN